MRSHDCIIRQSGWSSLGVLGFLLSIGIGAFVLKTVSSLIITFPGTPWVLISVLVLPLAFIFQLLYKTLELRELSNISISEKRRLKPILDGKVRQIILGVLFYVISAFIICVFFVWASDNLEKLSIALTIAGGLIGGSIFTIGLIVTEFSEIAAFKGNIHDRKEQEEKLNKVNEQLKKSS